MTHLDAAMLDELRELMEDDFGVLLDAYLSEAPLQRQAIEDARCADDADALRRSAHSLKGSSANIGAAALAQHCQRLEDQAASASGACLDSMLSELAEEYDAVYEEIGRLS